jgi:hypothetical protein
MQLFGKIMHFSSRVRNQGSVEQDLCSHVPIEMMYFFLHETH